MAEKLTKNELDKKRKEWKEKTKPQLEAGRYFQTPTVQLAEAYALLAQGVITRQDLLKSIKKGAEYYKSDVYGKDGQRARTKWAEEIIQQINSGTIQEIRGYKIPKKGDIMLKRGAGYVGFCEPKSIDTYFPGLSVSSAHPEIKLSIGPALIALEERLAKLQKSDLPGLHVFPRSSNAQSTQKTGYKKPSLL
jgi:hypothetical protein